MYINCYYRKNHISFICFCHWQYEGINRYYLAKMLRTEQYAHVLLFKHLTGKTKIVSEYFEVENTYYESNSDLWKSKHIRT